MEAGRMMTPEAFAVVYDLRDAGGWRQAHLHRRLWGHRFTDYYVLDQDHILMVFRPGGERWRPWEKARLRWILDEEAAA
jgi:hypothetical protein